MKTRNLILLILLISASVLFWGCPNKTKELTQTISEPCDTIHAGYCQGENGKTG